VIGVRHGIDKIMYKMLLGKLEGVENLGEIKVDAYENYKLYGIALVKTAFKKKRALFAS
jgi:hypothetical protein